MTLSALIRKREAGKSANDNPAKVANDGRIREQPLAGLAALALANPTSPDAEPRRRHLAELRRLIDQVADYNDFTPEDRQEALEIALGDAVSALECFRALSKGTSMEGILKAPGARRAAMLAEATQRYGDASARDMAASMRGWVAAKAVH